MTVSLGLLPSEEMNVGPVGPQFPQEMVTIEDQEGLLLCQVITKRSPHQTII